MMLSMLLAGLGLALLYAGGEALVRGASRLALRTGVSAVGVGLTVVAFGTSMPELVVSLNAALSGTTDIAIGNVVGSNICNVALILGVTVLVRPIVVHSKLVRVDGPIMVGCSLLALAMMANGTLGRLEGTMLLMGVLAFTAFTLRTARREPEPIQAEFAEATPRRPRPMAVDVLLIGIGLLTLVAGAHLLVGAAVDLARAWRVSEAVIGLTIVALGTSLPEFATSVVATLKGEGDIAVGNVIGSNIFNLLGILGTTALVRPLSLGGIAWLDLGAMLAAAILLLPLLYTGTRLSRPEGMLLVAGYAAYVAALLA